MPPRRLFGIEISGNTRKKPHLSPVQRQTIIAKFDAGVSVRELADEFERGVQTIQDTIKRWNLHQTTSDLPRSGRKLMLSLHQKKLIYRKARAQPKIEYKNLVEVSTFVNADGTLSKAPSRSTLYQCLKERGLTNYRCKKRPKLTGGMLLSVCSSANSTRRSSGRGVRLSS
jgi:transposase